jgi:threonyl-tRNA synthetase
MNEKISIDIMTKRHSLAHILAASVIEMFPDGQFGTGPATDTGFYYDFLLPRSLTPEDLKILSKKMRQMVTQNIAFEKRTLSWKEAYNLLQSKNQTLKCEILEKLEKEGYEEISLYASGDFEDLCKGPHVENTSDIDPQSFLLETISGAYWQNDSDKPMLQRITGLAFHNRNELKEYQKMRIEAQKRDHRKIGKAMNLFTFSELVGSGLPLFTPKGTAMRDAITNMIDRIQKPYGYEKVSIPHITKKDLYETSGHLEKFEEELFHVRGKSKTEFVMKPMNCPHHTQIFSSKTRSYKELPVRFTETTCVYRDEQAGELLGLSRVRAITQDDGHIFCRLNQVQTEIATIIEIIRAFYTKLDMWNEDTYEIHLSVRDPKNSDKYYGEKDTWDKAEKYLIDAAESFELKYIKDEGEAAFYGPKLDFYFKDALGRKWQLATIQLDFVMPQRFKLSYTDEEGKDETPVMIHRAIAGSLERFLSVMIEHFEGNFPLWLAPEQMRIVPIHTTEHEEYAKKIYKHMQSQDLRVTIDFKSDSLGKRIRTAEKEKVPYIILCGDEEQKNNTISIRNRITGEQYTKTITEVDEELQSLI